MWDSLESVWQAADSDDNWDVYVMPIPYYDKNNDGSLNIFHWEGNMFPKYVPIIDYKTIDLEIVHPDMIFIHNPYGDRNAITTIDPAYYSSKLRDYTEKLVYIPYRQ